MAAIGYRKNIDCLTADELHDFREALAEMYLLPASNPNSWAKQATFHGGTPGTAATARRASSPGIGPSSRRSRTHSRPSAAR
jgi:hypothetical protein